MEDIDLYESVIEYFKKKGNVEEVNYFSSILEDIEDDLEEDWEEDDDWPEEWPDWEEPSEWSDDDDSYEDELYNEFLEEFMSVIKMAATDNVQRNNTIEKYFEGKGEEELSAFLGPQVMFKDNDYAIKSQKDIKNFLLENYVELLKENMVYLTTNNIEFLEKAPASGYMEINLEKINLDKMENIMENAFLKQMGIAFWKLKKNTLQIHVPCIKEIKKILKDDDIMRKNKELNEKINIIQGMCEVHGAIKAHKIYEYFNKLYGEQKEEDFVMILQYICLVLQRANIKIIKKGNKFEFVYHKLIEEKEAKKIYNGDNDIEMYSKSDYIKYSNKDFVKDTKGYKKLEKQFNSDPFMGEFLIDLVNELLYPYTIRKRLGGADKDIIKDEFIEKLEEINDEMPIPVDVKKVRNAFKEFDEELPKWK